MVTHFQLELTIGHGKVKISCGWVSLLITKNSPRQASKGNLSID